jgi:hypothetical protein
MTDDRKDEHLRAQRRAAREYRRLGYEVLEQPRGDALPSFLRAFAPDLVVMKDDDQAVVEIKTRESIIGSNEFVELAKTIEAHPGWRLELISLGRRKEAAEELSRDALERLLAAGLSAYDAGQRDVALIYLVSVLDELVRDTAVRHRVKGRDRSASAVIQELAFQGIIDGETADVMDWAWQRRHAIVHGQVEAESASQTEIAQVAAACREVQAAMRLEAA